MDMIGERYFLVFWCHSTKDHEHIRETTLLFLDEDEYVSLHSTTLAQPASSNHPYSTIYLFNAGETLLVKV